MEIGSIQSAVSQLNSATLEPATADSGIVESPDDNEELRDAFSRFIGVSFYSQLIKAMRSSVGEPAYFHGGRAEEVFTAQLDQQLSEHMSAETADQLSGPMFELFMLPRP